MQLIKQVIITQCVTPTAGAAGTTAITGSTVDVSQGDGVLFLVTMGAITTGAVTSIKAQHGNLSTMSDAADLLGTSVTIADDTDDKQFYLEISRPTKRYVRLVVSRGTQNAVVASATAIVYKAKLQPTTQPSTVAGGETHVGEIAGTA